MQQRQTYEVIHQMAQCKARKALHRHRDLEGKARRQYIIANKADGVANGEGQRGIDKVQQQIVQRIMKCCGTNAYHTKTYCLTPALFICQLHLYFLIFLLIVE